MRRYDFNGSDAYTEEDPTGEYVEYEDAARIIAQRDRLVEALERIADNAGDNFIVRWAEDAIAELDREKQS